MRRIGFALALVVAVLAGVAGASAVVPSGGAETDDRALTPDGTGAAVAATAADPAGGGARWGVRVYRSQTGLTCFEPGRTVDGDFGSVDGDGQFHPNKLQDSGSCGDLAKEPYTLVVAHFGADGERGARAVVYGAVSERVKGITLTTAAGRVGRAVPVSGGAYVVALPRADVGGATVRVALTDGTTSTRTLAAGTPLADPEALARDAAAVP